MALMGFLEDKFSVKMSGNDLLPENFDSINTLSAMVDNIIDRQGEG
jgi:acyl carrier protein